MLADAVHRVGDPHEMLDELVGDLFVHRVVFGEKEGDLQHVLAVKRHPGRPVRLLQRAARCTKRSPTSSSSISCGSPTRWTASANIRTRCGMRRTDSFMICSGCPTARRCV